MEETGKKDPGPTATQERTASVSMDLLLAECREINAKVDALAYKQDHLNSTVFMLAVVAYGFYLYRSRKG